MFQRVDFRRTIVKSIPMFKIKRQGNAAIMTCELESARGGWVFASNLSPIIQLIGRRKNCSRRDLGRAPGGASWTNLSPLVWHKALRRFVLNPSHSTAETSASSSAQASHSICLSRPATVISSSLTYARVTCHGVAVGLPRRSCQRSRHSFLIELRIEGDISFFMYRLRHMAMASMSQCIATWPMHLQAVHWTLGRKRRQYLSGRARRPGPRGTGPHPQDVLAGLTCIIHHSLQTRGHCGRRVRRAHGIDHWEYAGHHCQPNSPVGHPVPNAHCPRWHDHPE